MKHIMITVSMLIVLVILPLIILGQGIPQAFMIWGWGWEESSTSLHIGYVSTQHDALNIRKGPGEHYDVIGKAAKNSILCILEEQESSWSNVLLPDGIQGYAAQAYIRPGSDRCVPASDATRRILSQQTYAEVSCENEVWALKNVYASPGLPVTLLSFKPSLQVLQGTTGKDLDAEDELEIELLVPALPTCPGVSVDDVVTDYPVAVIGLSVNQYAVIPWQSITDTQRIQQIHTRILHSPALLETQKIKYGCGLYDAFPTVARSDQRNSSPAHFMTRLWDRLFRFSTPVYAASDAKQEATPIPENAWKPIKVLAGDYQNYHLILVMYLDPENIEVTYSNPGDRAGPQLLVVNDTPYALSGRTVERFRNIAFIVNHELYITAQSLGRSCGVASSHLFHVTTHGLNMVYNSDRSN